jgi:hypothetical protein
VYDRNFAVFTNLYRANRENFRILAQKQPEMARAGARASG